MANLGRVNYIAQQRLDLSHLLMSEAFTAYDFRALITFMTGSSAAYVIRGFEIVNKSQFEIQVAVADSLTFNPLDGNGSFFRGLTDAELVSLSLAPSQTFYVEAVFQNETASPVNQAFWNPLALNQDDAAGNEFGASTNSQTVLKLTIPAPNTTGFTAGAIPLYKITTDPVQITSIIDCRPLLFRLGTGGAIPDPGHKFNWAPNRGEPVYSGTGVGQASGSPFQSEDASGILNDKGIKTLKDWMDAVMTRIGEITGSSLWYSANLAANYIDGLTLNSVYFDSPGGHSLNPSTTTTFKWTSGLTLTSEGQSPVEWQANYAGLKWRLGGTYTSATDHTYSNPRFTSPVPADGGNLYLMLKRDVPITVDDNPVNWKPAAVPTVYNSLNNYIITGGAGDFTGLAIGDYVRRSSEGYSSYYRVVSFTSGDSGVEVSADQAVADNTVTALRVARVITGATSTEHVRMFKSNYTSADLVADTNQSDVDAGIFPYQDIDAYWLGRRVGNKFILRTFGALEPGEEIEVTGDTETDSGSMAAGGGATDTLIEHAFNAQFTAGNVWQLKSGSGTVLTLRRRVRDNDVAAPGPSDNSNGVLTYTIPGPITINVGETLWVKLSNTSGGALSSGSVVTSGQDTLNTDTTTNVYEVRSAANTPLRDWNNKDVFMIARCTTTGSLLFFDGSQVNFWGTYIHQNWMVDGDMRAEADVYLMTKTNKSVLWIDENKRVWEDNANFWYDDAAQVLGVFNHRLGPNYLDLGTPADQTWLANLGQHTLTLGHADSTIRILGTVIIQGDALEEVTPVIMSEDKNIVLGVGNALNGGSGSGFSVVDNTKNALNVTTYSGESYVDVTYPVAHGYVIGDTVQTSVTLTAGGIPAGDMRQEYAVVALGGGPFPPLTIVGAAEVISSTVMRFYTSAIATSSATVATTSTNFFRSFMTPSYFQMSAANGGTGMTSWAFKVKNVNQIVTVTPVAGYDVVPTAKSTLFGNKRVPYANNDNSGPSGSDTTLDFSANFTWDNNTNTLIVDGTYWANTLIGSFSTFNQFVSDPTLVSGATVTTLSHFRANNPTMQAGATVTTQIGYNANALGGNATVYGFWANALAGTGTNYGFAADTINGGTTNYGFYANVTASAGGKTNWNFYGASTALSYLAGYLSLGQSAQANIVARLTLGPTNSTTAADGIQFGGDVNLYRLQADMLHTDDALDIGTFERFTNYAVNTAPATPPTDKVSIFARDGLMWQIDENGTIWPLTTPLGNIYDEPLVVMSSGATGNNQINIGSITPPVTISIPTDSRSVPVAFTQKTYVVGAGELEVYLNGDLLEKGHDYDEVGVFGSDSSQITLLNTTSISVGDRLRFRIDSNGGMYIVGSGGGGGGGGSLQSAYAGGNVINIASGSPVIIIGPAGQKALSVTGDMYLSGVLDPAGVTFTPQSSAPFVGQYGFWVDAAGTLMWRDADDNDMDVSDALQNSGISSAVFMSARWNGLGVLYAGTPVSIDSNGEIVAADPHVPALSEPFVGILIQDLNPGDTGQVAVAGLLEDILAIGNGGPANPFSTVNVGDVVYVALDGSWTATRPTAGNDGFDALDYILRIGVVVASQTLPGEKALVLQPTVIGQM